MMRPYRQAIKPALTYALLILSAGWLLWTAFELRYLQGWYAAQGVDRFYYPYGEMSAGALTLLGGYMLARTKRSALAVVIAFVVLLVTELFWIGYTR